MIFGVHEEQKNIKLFSLLTIKLLIMQKHSIKSSAFRNTFAPRENVDIFSCPFANEKLNKHYTRYKYLKISKSRQFTVGKLGRISWRMLLLTVPINLSIRKFQKII